MFKEIADRKLRNTGGNMSETKIEYPESINDYYAFFGGEELGVSLEKISIIWEACRKAFDTRGACFWECLEDEGYWESDCKLKWVLEDGTPFSNGMRYCPKCGKKLRRKNT